jgi:DNA-binding NarL/FixJ family response regulator
MWVDEMSNELEMIEDARWLTQRICHVLLIGLRPSVASQIADALSAMKWSVLEERESSSGIRQCALKRFDFVLIDVDGVDRFAPALVSDIRNGEPCNRSTTIVALSEFFVTGFKDRLLESGVDGFIRVSFDNSTLVTSLANASVARALANMACSTAGGGHPCP